MAFPSPHENDCFAPQIPPPSLTKMPSTLPSTQEEKPPLPRQGSTEAEQGSGGEEQEEGEEGQDTKGLPDDVLGEEEDEEEEEEEEKIMVDASTSTTGEEEMSGPSRVGKGQSKDGGKGKGKLKRTIATQETAAPAVTVKQEPIDEEEDVVRVKEEPIDEDEDVLEGDEPPRSPVRMSGAEWAAREAALRHEEEDMDREMAETPEPPETAEQMKLR